MLNFLNSFLSGRQMCTRVEKTYSAFRFTDMGIPQGSIISPILFSILIHDLPRFLSSNTQVAQYADDIAIWIKTKLRKNTRKRNINYIQSLYQNEIDNLSNYMKENGLELSSEKTRLMLFNNGDNPKCLPTISLHGQVLKYQNSVQFLGVIFTPKLNWRVHIETLISKTQKRLNLLKIVSRQPWAQDTKTLIHLTTALVRSKIVYGQEVYFSAARYLLNKLQSLDCKAIKIALGVPFHSNSLRCYMEAGIIPLSDYRKLASAKYITRCLSVSNYLRDEIFIDANDYPNRAKSIPYLQPIRNYTADLFKDSGVDIFNIQQMPQVPIMPQWEYYNAEFDHNYTSYNKNEEVHLLVTEVKEHINNRYSNYLKIYTDGSVLENGECGSAFVIPFLKVEKSFYIGKGFSVFTAEIFAILSALYFISNCYHSFYGILLCVDSISVLQSLQNWNNLRADLIFEIRHLIHFIKTKGIEISFCWVPSHIGIGGNEIADIKAKEGARKCGASEVFLNLGFSKSEMSSLLKQSLKTEYKAKSHFPECSRHTQIIINKLRLNTWNTKYSKDVTCVCKEKISMKHILLNCPILNRLYMDRGVIITENDVEKCLSDNARVVKIARVIVDSTINKLL